MRQDLMSDGSEFHVCGAATENARRANSVRVLAADSSGASEDRRGRTGTAGIAVMMIQICSGRVAAGSRGVSSLYFTAVCV